jgi:hypothetical protein
VIPNSIPPDASDVERAELKAAHAQLESVFLQQDEDAFGRWMEIRYELPLEWQDSQWIGNFRLWATAAEMRTFVKSVFKLAKPLRQSPRGEDPDRLEVHFTFRMLPQESPR